jgi:hypothetical protein
MIPEECSAAARSVAVKRWAKAVKGRPVTIDERLEALTHSVELIASMQLKTEKEIERLARYARTIVVDHEQRSAALEGDDEEDS